MISESQIKFDSESQINFLHNLKVFSNAVYNRHFLGSQSMDSNENKFSGETFYHGNAEKWC